ncbi:MAG: DUF799 domain-containing protein [Pseudomonadota bacterium]|nr:DUF799 domain-containing protein [Pseudomonadota bacterium]
MVNIKVKRYGTGDQVIASDTLDEVAARIVDLRDWACYGKATPLPVRQRTSPGGKGRGSAGACAC